MSEEHGLRPVAGDIDMISDEDFLVGHGEVLSRLCAGRKRNATAPINSRR
jgi:hypothetical protein